MNLPDEYAAALDVLGWINIPVAEAVRRLNKPHFVDVYRNHPRYAALVNEVAKDENAF
jgi:hypothetical protein